MRLRDGWVDRDSRVVAHVVLVLVLVLVLVAGLAWASSAQAAGFTATTSTISLGTADPFVAPIAIASADFNGDGRADLATANAGSASVSLLTNTGHGQFSPSHELFGTGFPSALATGDLNRDGRQDIAVTDLANDAVDLDIQDPASPTGFGAGFTLSTGSRPVSVAIGDLNGDRIPDVAVVNGGETDTDTYTLSLFIKNRRTGDYDTTTLTNFHDDGQGGAAAVAIGDINGDGRNDLVTANGDNNTVSLFLKNRRDAGYTQQVVPTTGARANSIAIGDLGGRGRGADLAVTNFGSNNVTIFVRDHGAPTGYRASTLQSNSPPVDISMFSVVIAELDGRPAVAAANRLGNSVTTWTENPRGPGFTPTTIPVGIQPLGVVAANLAGDRKPDLATVNEVTSDITLLTNTTPRRRGYG